MNYLSNITDSIWTGVQDFVNYTGLYNNGTQVPQQTNNSDFNWQGVTPVNSTSPNGNQNGQYDMGLNQNQGQTGWNWDGISKGLGGLTGVANSYIKYKNYQNAEDTLNFTKDAWQKDYDQAMADYQRQVEREEARESAIGNAGTTEDRLAAKNNGGV